MKSSLQLNAFDNGGATFDRDEPQRKKEKQSEFTQDEDARKGEITEAERREHGLSSLAIWLLWFKYAGGMLFVTVQISLMGFDRGAYVAIDFWLATWTSSAGKAIKVLGYTFPNQYETQIPYVLVYTSLVSFMFCFLLMRSQWMVAGGVRASKRVFSTMTHRVLHAPMSYFDTTPMGRILNRFTYDVEQVDITLAQFMSIFVIGKLLFTFLLEKRVCVGGFSVIFSVCGRTSHAHVKQLFSNIHSFLLVGRQPNCDL
jgi:ABC-type multidrug transport system fused ATPase/permease subunit